MIKDDKRSTDNSLNILKEYKNIKNRIIIFQKNNVGNLIKTLFNKNILIIIKKVN